MNRWIWMRRVLACATTRAAAIVAASLLLSFGAASRFAHAGDNVPLSAILPEFFAHGVALDPQIAGHEAHFLDQGDALAIMAQVDATLAAQFATYPLTSSSGAFTYTLDPETGQPLPTSESFGPIFAERPETLGLRKANLGVSTLNYNFDKLEGFKLDDGEIVFTLFHEDSDHNGNHVTASFEGDVIDSRLFLDLRLNTTIAFANFGVTDRFDLGVAIPYVRAKLDATVRDTILPVATLGGLHQFPGGALTENRVRSGDAEGIGDVVIRGKYNFKKGFAGAFDLRLPTGDEQNLLGSGATQLRVLIIARGSKYDVFYGGLYPHLNLGYTISQGDYTIPVSDSRGEDLRVEPSDEVNYALGFDAALGPRVTFALDVLGRLLLNTQRLSLREQTLLYTSVNGDVRNFNRPQLVNTRQDLSLIEGTAGVKVNVAQGLLVNVSGLVPLLKDRGLEANFTVAFGVDYTF